MFYQQAAPTSIGDPSTPCFLACRSYKCGAIFTNDHFRGDISKEERKAYIDGVLCLLNTPSKLDPELFPGAKNRYDDFVVVHMNQTLSIHGTVWASISMICLPMHSPC